jgi:hypothetical protein
VIGGVAAVLRRAPAATITALTVLVTAALVWESSGLPRAWGVDPATLPWFAAGLTAVLLPKQIRNLIAEHRRLSQTS